MIYDFNNIIYLVMHKLNNVVKLIRIKISINFMNSFIFVNKLLFNIVHIFIIIIRSITYNLFKHSINIWGYSGSMNINGLYKPSIIKEISIYYIICMVWLLFYSKYVY